MVNINTSAQENHKMISRIALKLILMLTFTINYIVHKLFISNYRFYLWPIDNYDSA